MPNAAKLLGRRANERSQKLYCGECQANATSGPYTTQHATGTHSCSALPHAVDTFQFDHDGEEHRLAELDHGRLGLGPQRAAADDRPGEHLRNREPQAEGEVADRFVRTLHR